MPRLLLGMELLLINRIAAELGLAKIKTTNLLAVSQQPALDL